MDPLLVQTNEAFRIREYPVRDGKCFVALHLLGGTHWALGVFDFPMRIAHVYDSLAYKYNYSSNYFENNEPAARSLWKKITDIPLEQIVIAGNEHVHSQVDHSSCGVFTCLYADRLANNIATKSEVATRSFLRSVRNLIDSRLRSCYVVDEADASGSVPLPRIYEQTLEKQCTLSFVGNVSDEHLNNVDASEISIPGKLTKIDIQSKNSEIIIPPSLSNNLRAATIEELILYHQIVSCKKPDITVVRMDLGDCAFLSSYASVHAPRSNGRENSILIVFYYNRNGYVSAAVFERQKQRPVGIVVDFQLNILDVHTRTQLRTVAKTHNFNNSTIRMCASCVPKIQCRITAALAVSCYVYQLYTCKDLCNVPISAEALERHGEGVADVVTMVPTLYSCGSIQNVVVEMYLHQYFSHKESVLFVDTLMTTLDSLQENARRCDSFNKTTLVILYINEIGDFCGALVKKHRRRSTGVIFEFGSRANHRSSLDFLTHTAELHGHVDCRFNVFAQSPFVFTHRSEFALAVGYCVSHGTTELSQRGLRQFSKRLFDVTFCGGSIPSVNTENADDTLLPLVEFTDEESDYETIDGVEVALHLGAMDKICQYCGAFSFKGEIKSLCCNGGTCMVPNEIFSPRKDPSLGWLWIQAQEDEKLYCMLRAINNLVAFAGLSMHLREFQVPAGQRPLIVQGAIDVGICHLNPDSRIALYAQLYICDDFKATNSLKETMQQWRIKVDHKLIEKIVAIMKKQNVIAQCYRSMYEIYVSEMESHKSSESEISPKVLMNIKHKREISREQLVTTHEGCLNVPQVNNQIAAIYVCRNGVMPSHEELDKGLRIMSTGGKSIAAHHDNNIDAMTYPLYFTRGEQSYVRESLRKRAKKRPAARNNDNDSLDEEGSEKNDFSVSSRKFLSRAQFYRFVLSRRGNLLEHRFYGSGKLLSQFIIHVFSRIEADRLSAVGLNSTEIRSSKASTLYSYLDQQLQEKGLKLGKLVNLPRHFVGSRLWYDDLYHNAMTVAQRVGRPDLFITFTGNQDWPEIRENLVTQFDSWITDPLLCARVFRLRLQNLISDLVDKQIFGKVNALQYSVEFQKRGMPHAHILLTLENKINTPDKVDEIISAELPEHPSDDDPQRMEKLSMLHLVSRFMVHSPCKDRPHLACRSRNPDFCEKRFPKSFRNETELCNDGYPLYRRRDNGRTVLVGAKKISEACNRDVVPYNPYLLSKYQCHINVECCCSISAFKYIFKYIYKGPDQLIFDLLYSKGLQPGVEVAANKQGVVDVDTRKTFLEARYLSHMESAYRLLGFPMQYNLHTVFSLSAHLPGEEPVYFKGLPQRKIMPRSKLLAYFDLVKTCPRARNLTWIEVAEQFHFNGSAYELFKNNGRRIARIYSVSPKFSELYALRKLLFYTRGASSFEDIRTVRGVLYETFMEAAAAAGYVETEKEWEDCLDSACETDMPTDIRRLYAQILLYCHPTNPVYLWEKYKQAMRPRSITETDDQLDMRSIDHIDSILTRNGMSLEDCGLKVIRDNLINALGNEISLERETFEYDTPVRNFVLTRAQQKIVDTIFAASLTPKTNGNKLFYIDGKAGCGKTYTLNALIDRLEKAGKKVLATASTGIAATLLKDGRTAHSLFRLPLKSLNSLSVANVDASSPIGQTLNAVDVIVWDEISMQSRFVLECVERLLRDVASPLASSSLFAGVTLVLGGDWCQFLPVLQGATRQETVDITFKRSELWKYFKTFTLDENMRLGLDDREHADWLLSVGLGKNFSDEDNIVIPPSFCMATEADIIEWVYSADILKDPSTLAKVALLTVRNCDAEELNSKVLERLPGACVDIIGIDTPSVEEDNGDGLPCDNEEYFHKLTPSSLPPYTLHLKPGSIIMLLRNLDVSAQLCNGTRLVVLSIKADKKLLKCRNLSNGEPANITRMHLDYCNEKSGIAFRRLQFPIRLAFCLTVNKSQGQTFDKVGVILRTPSFAHGSTYVALSRCTTKEGLKVTRNWAKVPSLPKIRNVVYEEIL